MSRRAGTPTAKKVTQLVNVEEHVEGFRQVREAHRRELIDDYVELISDLIREVGEARQVDMAARLGVSQPTVAKMLKRLATMGLIEMIPWRGVFLTAEGEKLAQESRERHQIVENFLLVLGVSPEIRESFREEYCFSVPSSARNPYAETAATPGTVCISSASWHSSASFLMQRSISFSSTCSCEFNVAITCSLTF